MSLPFMDIFKDWASEYDNFVAGQDPEYQDVFINYEFMIEQAVKHAKGNVVEFGPGTGNMTRYLINQGLNVRAVEPSEEMAAIGEKKTGITFERGDFLNFKAEMVDTFISSFAFHHLTDIEKDIAIGKYAELLNEEGCIIILDTIFNSKEEKQAMIEHYTRLGYNNLVEDLNREYYPFKETMAAIASRNGFDYHDTQLNRFAHLQILKKKNIKKPFDLIGNTPLVEITAFPLNKGNRLFAKLENHNLGGSIKDRLGFNIISKALARGDINNGLVVEATAGNTGIGLALVCQKFDLKLRVYVPEKFSVEKQSIMRALGAEIINTPTEKGMLFAREEALKYAQETGAFFTNQFESSDNPSSYEGLAHEIIDEVGRVDMIVAGAGSGGTFTGLAHYFKDAHKVIVEPEGSILNGGASGSHRTEGIGVEAWPVFLPKDLIDAVETISDVDAFTKVTELAKLEGLMQGSSSGAALQAALNQQKNYTNQNIIVIFPDASDRYLSKKIFNIEGE
ncbi:pyridoxal-phosphate dependent enzyme [Macrococcoides caseolyticum]|uniref:pyridoxal-phosphate dependent enzyme n=1 Tax=Macrococcoides caseolyticum TaxID=69966 RepID=UPI002D809F0B|nr:pyridoxal-phosphate dependent enzyme [Macrococcus caseolyticus]MCE4957562.1 pyridoxal-phosphate dependent enzyme [Macrococcus caseolyticus]